ncbi:hypothetical protein [Saccharothrix sp. HUAS TT1]|uniref:hypothetical protein n=1 Tax=unclassified Saccharothrix TaxID=2593673 RepID=UPI00345B5390
MERFVCRDLLDWGLDPRAAEADPRVLLLTVPSGELVGVAAHEHAALLAPGGQRIEATKLQVVALSLHWQGRSFESGPRASDVLMSAAMTDIGTRRPPRAARVFAVVHRENTRSLAVLRRFGLTEEMSDATPPYRRVITPAC